MKPKRYLAFVVACCAVLAYFAEFRPTHPSRRLITILPQLAVAVRAVRAVQRLSRTPTTVPPLQQRLPLDAHLRNSSSHLLRTGMSSRDRDVGDSRTFAAGRNVAVPIAASDAAAAATAAALAARDDGRKVVDALPKIFTHRRAQSVGIEAGPTGTLAGEKGSTTVVRPGSIAACSHCCTKVAEARVGDCRWVSAVDAW